MEWGPVLRNAPVSVGSTLPRTAHRYPGGIQARGAPLAAATGPDDGLRGWEYMGTGKSLDLSVSAANVEQ